MRVRGSAFRVCAGSGMLVMDLHPDVMLNVLKGGFENIERIDVSPHTSLRIMFCPYLLICFRTNRSVSQLLRVSTS